uniref:F-box domain-containing protein n=2 Tax=Caenorhabditis tropicalis TaxID=1561998 RepID=A0A1I7TLD0_9PELO
MPSSMSLLNVSNVAMDTILRGCDFLSLQILRKVCHDIRNFIDDVCPFKIVVLGILVFPNSISFQLDYMTKEDGLVKSVDFDYDENIENSCFVSASAEKDGVSRRALTNRDFVEVFMSDFSCILKQLKTEIGRFELVMRPFTPNHWTPQERQQIDVKFLNNFKEVLKSNKMRTKNIVLKMKQSDNGCFTIFGC